MSLSRIISLVDKPVTWLVAGLALGLGLNVTTASAWLMALALAGYLLNMGRRSHLEKGEGWLFATGPAFMVAWLLGFIIRGMTFG